MKRFLVVFGVLAKGVICGRILFLRFTDLFTAFGWAEGFEGLRSTGVGTGLRR